MRVWRFVLAGTLALAACGSSGGGSSTGGSINVLAGSSLTEAFTALAKQFEAAHPGTHVNLSFGSSTTLAGQIQDGARADVFASADQNPDDIVARWRLESAEATRRFLESLVSP